MIISLRGRRRIRTLIEKQDGEQWELEIEKDADEQLGIEFGQG